MYNVFKPLCKTILHLAIPTTLEIIQTQLAVHQGSGSAGVHVTAVLSSGIHHDELYLSSKIHCFSIFCDAFRDDEGLLVCGEDREDHGFKH